MSRVIKKAILLIVMVAAVALAQPNSIVGSWVQADKGIRWTFRADGTGFMEQPNTTARFNWQVQGQTLQVKSSGMSVPYQVVQLDGQNLVIRNQQISQQYQLRRDG
jgi:uncharacterized protein DUF5640